MADLSDADECTTRGEKLQYHVHLYVILGAGSESGHIDKYIWVKVGPLYSSRGSTLRADFVSVKMVMLMTRSVVIYLQPLTKGPLKVSIVLGGSLQTLPRIKR